MRTLRREADCTQLGQLASKVRHVRISEVYNEKPTFVFNNPFPDRLRIGNVFINF